ncbi:Putative metallopeptidase [Devosia crocina]|uniref:Putative metallopeptidase n=2 Tax=Devosia crocina TaxID=429728 RepID=A0A1I7NKX5_9HYPH|nr:Putative metallopeptidase [Devosia crocina]
MKRVLALLGSALLISTASPALAQDMTGFSKAQRNDIIRFAANNSLFVLYHEMAHLLIDQLRLPVLGKEEDAADHMATWTLLRHRTAEADTVLADAAEGWILSGIAYGSGEYEADFFGAHSLDKQRAYQIVCLMVGSDDTAFRPIANQYAIDRDRQDTCHYDYETVDRSLRAVLDEHRVDSGTGTKVDVTYHDAGGRLRFAADAFRSSGVFDRVAEDLRSTYKLRRPVRFNAKRCGEANAYYDPATVEIIFCYELMKDYMELYAAELPDETSPEPREKGAGKVKSSGS